jgi:site-specific DNA recombinase
MPVAAYLRVSPSDPEQESIENQRVIIQSYLKQYGLDIASEHWYEDDQVYSTLSLQERPNGAARLRAALLHQFDTVIVSRVDRLARDPRLTLNVVHELKQCGASIVSVREGTFETSAERLMLTMLAGFAGYERESIMERTGAGMQRVAREGTWMGGTARYGYYVEGRKREARLALNHAPIPGVGMSEVQVVRWIYQHCTVERGSCESAAKYLNRLRIHPRGGNLWYASTVYRLITSATYKGIDMWKHIERQCEPIVDNETWELAQRQLAMNRRTSRRNSKSEYLLGGLIKCGICGSNYVGRAVDQGKKYRYYVCLKRTLTYPPCEETIRCSSPNIPARLEDTVWAEIEQFARNPGEVLLELETKHGERTSLIEQLEIERNALSRELAGKDDEKDLILGLYRTRRITQSKVDQQFADIDAQSRALQERIIFLEQRINGMQYAEQQARTLETLLSDLRQRIDAGLSFAEKRYITMQWVDSIVIKDGQVYVVYLFQKPDSVAAFELHTGSRVQLNRQYRICAYTPN